MLKNHIKIAWRNLLRNKGFSAINIFGLAIGLAVFILIALFVLDELSYDRYNEHADRIYRVNTDIQINGSGFNSHVTPAPMANALVNTYPQIEQSVRILADGEMLVQKENETIMEQHSFFADPTLFDVFTFNMISGDPKTALVQPYTMVISESMAMKYFNSTNVVGKTLKVDNTTRYEITGVIKDTPAQSHLHFNFIKSLSSNEDSKSDFWLSASFDTYVLLRRGTSEAALDSYLAEAAKKFAEPQLLNVVHSSISDLQKNGDYFKYTSIPLTKIHLFSKLPSEIEPAGNIQYVYIFAVIGLFILLIACINFMNLSTARSSGRAKEVGVRKVIGSSRANLIKQFLTESLLTCLLAFVLALLLAICLLPYLNDLSGKDLKLYSVSSLWLFPCLLSVAFITGLFAGSYPAFFLSAFDPVEILKGKFSLGFKGNRLRNTLVIFQFTTVIILIVGTLVIYSQLNYIQHKNLGYSREHVLVVQNAYALGEHAQIFKDEVLQIAGVLAGSRSSTLPTSSANTWSKNAYSKDASMNADQTQTLTDWEVDADYIPTFKMKMVKGRNFSSKMATDSNAIIINESAARVLMFKDPINARLYGFDNDLGTEGYNIIGVVKDFNAGSVRYETEPMILHLSKYGGQFSFRIKSQNIQQVIEKIKTTYHAFEGMNNQPFLYSFLDDDFNHLYSAEQRTGKIFISFSVLAVLIACLGLFGLSSYAVEQRTKEIGIRKVLGSSVKGIVRLLSKDFIKLIFVSIIIASPLAWWAMSKWLEDFAYRIEIQWWMFGLAGMLALIIALLTVSFQAVKAAVANPVKSLRAE